MLPIAAFLLLAFLLVYGSSSLKSCNKFVRQKDLKDTISPLLGCGKANFKHGGKSDP